MSEPRLVGKCVFEGCDNEGDVSIWYEDINGRNSMFKACVCDQHEVGRCTFEYYRCGHIYDIVKIKEEFDESK